MALSRWDRQSWVEREAADVDIAAFMGEMRQENSTPSPVSGNKIPHQRPTHPPPFCGRPYKQQKSPTFLAPLKDSRWEDSGREKRLDGYRKSTFKRQKIDRSIPNPPSKRENHLSSIPSPLPLTSYTNINQEPRNEYTAKKRDDRSIARRVKVRWI